MKSVLILYIIPTIFSLQCDKIKDENKFECGYPSISKDECEKSNCCWKPYDTLKSVPWCYHSVSTTSCPLKSNSSINEVPFTLSEQAKLYKYFMSNINYNNQGAVIASPDPDTPGGSYRYHWARDSALTMFTVLKLNDFTDEIKTLLYNWIEYEKRIMSKPSSHNTLVEPKFEIASEEPYRGDWCRPQTDGAPLRLRTILEFGIQLLAVNNITESINLIFTDFINQHINYIIHHWNDSSCDLWEELRGENILWNQMSFRVALKYLIVYKLKLIEVIDKNWDQLINDNQNENSKNVILNVIKKFFPNEKKNIHLVRKNIGMLIKNFKNDIDLYQVIIDQIESNIKKNNVINNTLIEMKGRERDGAIILSLVEFDLNDNFISPIDMISLTSVRSLINMFCELYPINKKRNFSVLIGRYYNDIYANGNPWILHTAALAEYMYILAEKIIDKSHEIDLSQWDNIVTSIQKIIGNETETNKDVLIKDIISAGDSILLNLRDIVKPYDFHMAEQIDKNDGKQIAAKDLTWSYSCVLRALKKREETMEKLLDNQDF